MIFRPSDLQGEVYTTIALGAWDDQHSSFSTKSTDARQSSVKDIAMWPMRRHVVASVKLL